MHKTKVSTKKMKEFINDMANQYTMQFNVYREERIGDTLLDFYAEFKRRDEKYLMSKSIKVWSVENQQYAFVKHQEQAITPSDIKKFAKDIDARIKEFVPSKREHMSTFFIGFIVTNQPIDKAVLKEVKKARKLQFLKFGLHGWADRYIAIVDLTERKVLVNNKGREFVKGFQDALLKGEARV
ncbi:hypothetical protein [Alkalihalophilus marmarensis]|nr:hypothetical protein [Alkalihalophilus marmarensis]